jgi:hypothetical protein
MWKGEEIGRTGMAHVGSNLLKERRLEDRSVEGSWWWSAKRAGEREKESQLASSGKGSKARGQAAGLTPTASRVLHPNPSTTPASRGSIRSETRWSEDSTISAPYYRRPTEGSSAEGSERRE